MIELIYLYRIGLALILSLFIGWEREQQHKQAGLRTVSLITLGATLIVITTLKWDIYSGLNNSFDAIRAIAYYLVGIGFVGGGMIRQEKGKLIGLTTASLLLPVSVIGFLCGMGEYSLAIFSSLIIYFILKLKYVKITVETHRKKRDKRCKKTK